MMKRGAVAMFDALGFKGIWRRPGIREDPEVVLRKLQSLRTEAHHVADRYLPTGATTEEKLAHQLAADPPDRGAPAGESAVATMDIRFLSDTIVVAFTAKSEQEWIRRAPPSASILQATVVSLACHVSSELLYEAAKTEPALAYRGCVAYGDFAIDGSFIIGEAVDRAADSLSLAQGAFVWLLPEAKSVYQACLVHDTKPESPIFYRVPLKGGDAFDTYAVSPLLFVEKADIDCVSKRILDTFDRPQMDVQVKRQHTEVFLRACALAKTERKG